MNEKLQAERDLRARIKDRLECGCVHRSCGAHGPADAADMMLVNCIYMNEHVRQYGMPAGALKHILLPSGTPTFDYDEQYWPDVRQWKPVDAPGWYTTEAHIVRRPVLPRDPPKNPTAEKRCCVDCGRQMLKASARADGEPTTVGYHQCQCRSDDPFGKEHNGRFNTYTGQEDPAYFKNYFAAAEQWARDVIGHHDMKQYAREDEFAAIARHLLFKKEQAEKLQAEVDAIYNILPADSRCKVESCRLVSEDVKDLVDFQEATKEENAELGRMLVEHGLKDNEFLPGLLVRKDAMIWELIEALFPFAMYGKVYKDRKDGLTAVLKKGTQGLVIFAFQNALETYKTVIQLCPSRTEPTA